MNFFLILTAFALLLSQCFTKDAKTYRRNMIEYINRNQTTWTAGENFPQDVTMKDLKRLTGVLGTHPNPEKMTVKRHPVVGDAIPDYFDSRVNWPECAYVINNIRNQGDCGSSWAFGSVEALTDRLCIASGGDIKIQLSPQDPIECCSDCVSDASDTCAGGYTGSAWEFFVNTGVVTGGDYNSDEGCKPYSEAAYGGHRGPAACVEFCEMYYNVRYDDDKRKAVSSYTLENDVEQIQLEIMANGPVTAVLEVYEDFYNYKWDVYQHVTGDFVGNHSVKIIGWGQENVPFWWAANSWGDQWGGIGGFFKILRGENHVGIEGSIVAGLPSV